MECQTFVCHIFSYTIHAVMIRRTESYSEWYTANENDGDRRRLYARSIFMPAPTQPIRVLAVDVGTGTQDILLFESGKTIENCFKMVMPSPTVIIAERIKRATEQGQPILLTGVTMGGGPCHW